MLLTVKEHMKLAEGETTKPGLMKKINIGATDCSMVVSLAGSLSSIGTWRAGWMSSPQCFRSWEEGLFLTQNCQAVLGNNEPYY